MTARTSTSKPVIAFVGAVYPGQFGGLCDNLRKENLAETYFFTTPGNCKRNNRHRPHLRAFVPDGDIVGSQGYYYSAKVERSARISHGLRDAIRDFEKEKKIDILVCHSLWGAPHMLYGETDAAIVSYIEFPSYRTHGWDPTYPPSPSQRLTDHNSEMLNLYQVVRSDLVICPSHHAKSMIPRALQGKVEVQMEGFDITSWKTITPAGKESPFTVGFAARDLSSAKGIDRFMSIANTLVKKDNEIEFIVIGGENASSYGYESQWVKQRYPNEDVSFAEHLRRLHPKAARKVKFAGLLNYDEYEKTLQGIDVFLYPLRHGVANWGLVEILGRGGCVVASNHGYPAEIIQHDINGCLLPHDEKHWVKEVLSLKHDPTRRQMYSDNARKMAQQEFSIEVVADRYMRLFRQAIVNRAERLACASLY